MVLDRFMKGNLATEASEPGAELESGAKEELGTGLGEVVLLQSGLDDLKVVGEALEFIFESGDELLLEGFELESASEMDFLTQIALPTKEGRARNVQFLGDFAKAAAIGAQDQKSGFGFVGVHRF